MYDAYNDPSNRDLLQNITAGNSYISSELNAINTRINSALKPPAPKLTGHSIHLDKGMLYFVREFDDGVGRTCPLFTTNTGECNIFRLSFTEFAWTADLFCIEFPNINENIIGDCKRLKGAYLYDLFVQQGFGFHSSVVQSKLPKALNAFFAPQILKTQRYLEFPALAGFSSESRFFYSDCIPKCSILSELPISSKHFEKLPMEQDTFDLYREKMLAFTNPRERFLVVVYPFLSLMSSFFEMEDRSFDFSLNFVPTDGFNAKKLCRLFQIFNRDVLTPINAEMTPKSVEKFLRTVKDETIILDCRSNGDNDYYREGLRTNNLQRFRALLSGQKSLPDQKRNKICAGLITICDNVLFDGKVQNILLDSNLLENLDMPNCDIDLFAENKVMERVFTQFVSYIEGLKKEEVWMIFLKKRPYSEDMCITLTIIDEILTNFWRQYNLDFHAELGFPDEIDFSRFCRPSEEVSDGNIKAFVDFIYDAVSDYHIVPKNSPIAGPTTIYYNDAHIWFPVPLFSEMCKNAGLRDARKILLELRERGTLITDIDSLSRRAQVNCQSFEAYQFVRETFNLPGGIDIIECGKEIAE